MKIIFSLLILSTISATQLTNIDFGLLREDDPHAERCVREFKRIGDDIKDAFNELPNI